MALALGLALSTSVAVAAPSTANPSARAASVHHFRGSVSHVDRNHHWFRMQTTDHHTVRIYTNSTTHWDNCDWGQMQSGRHADVYAHSTHGTWIATRLQPWGHDWDHD